MSKMYSEIEEGRDWPFLGGSQVSNARPHGTPGQAGAPIAFLEGVSYKTSGSMGHITFRSLPVSAGANRARLSSLSRIREDSPR